MAIKTTAKAETAYKKKIADLHKDVETAAKKLQAEQERYEAAKKEAKALEGEVSKLTRDRDELAREIERLSEAVAGKRTEGEAVVAATHEDVSRLTLEKETLDFTLDQLKAKAADAHAKATEIHDIQARHAEAKARLDATLTAVTEAETRRDTAQAAADAVAATARAREEEILVRERKVEAAEAEILTKHSAAEFFRNRIVAYCVEKGLPIPTFEGDGSA